MSAPATEELREIENMLVAASEQGETLMTAAVAEQLGLDGDEAHEALVTLSQHGKAEQVAPGEWTQPDPAERRAEAKAEAAGRVRVALGEEAHDLEPGETHERALLSEAPALAPTVRLTMAIAKAMTAEALGGLVKAGIDDADTRGETFTLEVLP